MNGLILVLNCGSSSIKFALFDAAAQPLPHAPLWSGKADGITGPAPTFEETGAAPEAVKLGTAHPYHDALRLIRAHVSVRLADRRIAAVAHRVVHGGSKYFKPTRVDQHVLAGLRSYIPLAPLHQPFALEAIAALLDAEPGMPQVACFDTGFHHDMPMVEQMLPLAWEWWERGVRRYGFHGLSYEYQSIALAERWHERAFWRTIVAHLGSGASLCAMDGLKSVATTMGFSALEGLMMGTRTGALDPGAVLYLMEVQKLGLQEVGALLYHHSGLFGVSGISSDPRVLLQVENRNERARAALALYVRRIVREIGALTAVLGGLDMLVFTAGVGEHNAVIRERVCADLSFLGLQIDSVANGLSAPLISTPASPVLVAVEPTNEEWIAALHTQELLAS